MEHVRLMTPKGIELYLDVEQILRTEAYAECAVRKYSGDDPDVTDGLLVFARAEKADFAVQDKREDACFTGDGIFVEDGVFIEGGVGVGRPQEEGGGEARAQRRTGSGGLPVGLRAGGPGAADAPHGGAWVAGGFVRWGTDVSGGAGGRG